METETVEERALDGFLDRYDETVRAVYAYLLRACAGDRTRAEDLTQETYAAALKKWKAGHGEDVTLPWLIAVARNKMIDAYRRLDRESRLIGRIGRATPSSQHDREDMMACVRALPPLQRAVIVLRFVDDLPIGQIAELLGRRVAAIDSLQRRALANLRTMLEETNDEH